MSGEGAHASGLAKRDGRGLFAGLLRANPRAGRGGGPPERAVLRENWIERVFAYRRLRSLFAGPGSVGRLVAFHTAHKLQLLAHGAEAYRRLGRLVAGAKKLERAELRRRYETGFMEALAVRATPRRHVNVLQHCLGYFKERLEPGTRAALAAQVADYQQGLVPLVVPVTMIRHYVEQLGVEYLAGQVYSRRTEGVMLRNRV